MKNALDMLQQFDPELKDTQGRSHRTFDGRFVAIDLRVRCWNDAE